MMKEESHFDDKLFFTIIKPLSDPLISYAGFALSIEKREEVLNTDFLGRTIAISSRLEEILDHYNAKNNQKWRPFREHIASVKIFTTVSYTTLHLKSTSPQYKLLSGIETFLSDTEGVLDLFSSTLQEIFRELLKSAGRNGLKEYRKIKQGFFETVDFPEGRLKSDLKKNRVDSPEKVIVNLATTYLNLASESVLLEEIGQVEYQKYEDLVPDVISENAIRIMENKFHNLQSLYDTYISDTDIEDMDRDLKLIRGHASIVFHLLEASTNIIHYYERHMMNLTGGRRIKPHSPISTEKILGILIQYYLNYSNQFLAAGKALCKEVIRKYAEEGRIDVRVPGYRGFHVRPSTLVSKIVQHYGSDVHLIMGEERFDASLPMNLFRVNEKINAEKRSKLAQQINTLESVHNPDCNRNFEKGLKEIFHELLEENKIINYATEFSLPDLEVVSEETLGEFANRAIAYLLAEGKIDLKTDLTVSFEGDKRVLADLQILADCGYGEDCHGNNIVLPAELSYIRR